MSGNVVNLADARRRGRNGLLEETSIQLMFDGGCYKIAVLPDSTVAMDIHMQGGEALPFRIRPGQAKAWGRALIAAARASEERQKELRGAKRWVAMSAEGPGRYTLRHDDRERVFERCKIGRRRGLVSCESCRSEFSSGDTAYRECDPKPYDYPNWSRVRLCTICVETPARDGAEAATAR